MMFGSSRRKSVSTELTNFVRDKWPTLWSIDGSAGRMRHLSRAAPTPWPNSEGNVLMSKSVSVNSAHTSALAARHAVLESRLDAETHRPMPDSATIAQLKKAKLRIKDELDQH